MIPNFLKKIDLYGIPYYFTVFNEPAYKTKIGGIMTIFTALLYALCFVYFGKDFYNRENPVFVSQASQLEDYKKFNISRDDLLMAIRVEDEDSNPYNITGLLQIESYYVGYSSSNSESRKLFKKSMDKINCGEINSSNMRLSTKKNLSKMECLKFNNTVLGGYWDGDFTYYLQITVKPCINSTINNNSCIPLDQAISILNSGNLSFNAYTNKHFTKLNDYDNPLKITLYNAYGDLSSDTGKILRLFYKTASIKTDLGIITDMSNNYTVYGLDYVIADVFPPSPPYRNATDATIVASFEIFILNNIQTYQVTYIKIQQIFAYIGGFISFISFFLDFLTGMINEHYRTLQIINKLFDFNELNNEEKLNSLIKEHASEQFGETSQVDKEFKKKISTNNKNVDDKNLNQIKPSEMDNQSKYSPKYINNPESNINPSLISSPFKTPRGKLNHKLENSKKRIFNKISESQINLNGKIHFKIRYYKFKKYSRNQEKRFSSY